MNSKILMCTAVVAATVAVVLLSVLTPGGSRGGGAAPRPKSAQPNPNPNSNPKRKEAGLFSLYVQRSPPGASVNADSKLPAAPQIAVFDQPLTEGPKNTSRVIGRAQGFALPTGIFSAASAFNIFNLNINTSEYAGSVSVQGKRYGQPQLLPREELPVVGGTGYFAFATGFAVFKSGAADAGGGASSGPLYHVKLHLRFRGG